MVKGRAEGWFRSPSYGKTNTGGLANCKAVIGAAVIGDNTGGLVILAGKAVIGAAVIGDNIGELVILAGKAVIGAAVIGDNTGELVILAGRAVIGGAVAKGGCDAVRLLFTVLVGAIDVGTSKGEGAKV
mmetsp:Transcript_25485/g.36526  ORF Transcript_25485/g.36526 Transcript_25485/m.36526 type:complete len:129 (+) Transcript_25485:42-428(+)